ncbi:cilia- and flagella-associated protein 20-like [Anoplophora glabripennis]|uniref:cilia- and flagella-associated protein 20-like n=1 Tax=Anoplophora glabripennis TaxID=217634 RepID=UPI00087445EF|nr:cilia- and flagella-associated protein 20-like [Anoplophora glabripennis]
MFSNSYQSGFLSIFYSVGSNPLALWDKHVKNGHIRRVVDDDVKSLVLEIAGTNVATTYITCPIQARASLGVQLPFLVMVIKNMKRYFTFEIQILDDKDMRRRFRVSNFQSSTKVLPFCTTMPIGLSDGWNQVQFNLADFTKRAYGSTYMETTRVQIHANVRIRRIYFSDRLYSEEDMPNEFKLFAPVEEPMRKSVEKVPDEVPPIPTTPMEDDKTKALPDIAAPSPVDTGALNTSEVDMKPEEAETVEAPPEEKEAVEAAEVPEESAEVTAPEEGTESPVPEEGGEAPASAVADTSTLDPTSFLLAPTEETTEQAPTEATEEPAATTSELATTEEPEPTTTEEPASTEVATTEEPGTTEAPTESEVGSPEK